MILHGLRDGSSFPGAKVCRKPGDQAHLFLEVARFVQGHLLGMLFPTICTAFSSIRQLSPFVSGAQTLVDHVVEAAALLDEDL